MKSLEKLQTEASNVMKHEVVRKLRERYQGVPQVIFIRSLEKARTLGDLFDIVSTAPTKFPLEWNSNERRWVTSKV